MTSAQEIQDFLLGRSSQAKSFCSRCLARELEIPIGEVIGAMGCLRDQGSYVTRWGTCDRCERRWVFVINTIIRARGEHIDGEPQEEPGESNAV